MPIDSIEWIDADSLTDCDPVITNKDMGKTVSIGGNSLDPDEAAFPCGLVAKSYFDDEYELIYTQDNKNEKVKIDDTGIAWDSDKEFKFKNLEQAEMN